MTFVPEVPDSWRKYAPIAKDDKWTISNERAYMEDLVYKRLTTFFAIAAAIIAGAINLRETLPLSTALLVLGSVLCWTLQSAISRAQRKLDIILTILFKDLSHPAGYINDVLQDDGRVGFVGHIVPKAICILLSAAAIVTFALLNIPPRAVQPSHQLVTSECQSG